MKKIRTVAVFMVCAGLVHLASGQTKKESGVRMSVPTTDYVYQYVPPQPRLAAAALTTNYTSGDSAGQAHRSDGQQSNQPRQGRAGTHRQPESAGVAVHVGFIPCAMGTGVLIEQDRYSPGYFKMQHGEASYDLHQVPTSTGAVRLEDDDRSVVWLQLANKSMLLDHAAGSRLADDCANRDQIVQAQIMQSNPSMNLLNGIQ